ncbi:hypothetical protein [Helicobacter sp. 23-1045]
MQRITIEVVAVWLCTKFVALLGDRTNGSSTTQGRQTSCELHTQIQIVAHH